MLSFISQEQDVGGGSRGHEPSSSADERASNVPRRATAKERGFLAAKEQLKPTGLAAKNHLGMWTVAKKTVNPPTREERERERERLWELH